MLEYGDVDAPFTIFQTIPREYIPIKSLCTLHDLGIRNASMLIVEAKEGDDENFLEHVVGVQVRLAFVTFLHLVRHYPTYLPCFIRLE